MEQNEQICNFDLR